MVHSTELLENAPRRRGTRAPVMNYTLSVALKGTMRGSASSTVHASRCNTKQLSLSYINEQALNCKECALPSVECLFLVQFLPGVAPSANSQKSPAKKVGNRGFWKEVKERVSVRFCKIYVK